MAAIPVFLFCFRHSSNPNGPLRRVARRLLQLRHVRHEFARWLRRTRWSRASTVAADLAAHAGGSGSSSSEQATWCSPAPGWQIWLCIPAAVAPALVSTRRGARLLGGRQIRQPCSSSSPCALIAHLGLDSMDQVSVPPLPGLIRWTLETWIFDGDKSPHSHSVGMTLCELAIEECKCFGCRVQVLWMQRNEPCRQKCGLALRLGLQGKTAEADQNSRQAARLHQCGNQLMMLIIRCLLLPAS